MSIVGSLCFYVVIALLAPAAIWTAGSVCGISGMLAGLAGIILGILALKQIKAAPAQKGKRLAIGSIIISGIYLLLLGFIFVSSF